MQRMNLSSKDTFHNNNDILFKNVQKDIKNKPLENEINNYNIKHSNSLRFNTNNDLQKKEENEFKNISNNNINQNNTYNSAKVKKVKRSKMKFTKFKKLNI